MEQPPPPTMPAWVSKRDGRVVPFEPDRISRALFAAGESLGRPDAFMARELADGVLHFLAAEADRPVLPSAQIAEVVVKVVRELGQPALSQAFADFARQKAAGRVHPTRPNVPSPALPSTAPDLLGQVASWVAAAPPPAELVWRVAGACLRAYSLREVFARDLVSAHREGLLTLTGLEAPLELAACVLGRPKTGPGGLARAVEEARGIAGRLIAVDGPEYGVGPSSSSGEAAGEFARELALALRVTGLRAIVNLNSSSPPPWADELAEGPLFPGNRPPPAEGTGPSSEDFLGRLLSGKALEGRVRVDWRLGERDWGPEARGRLLRLARRACEGAPLAFVFDRPRRPPVLAEGLDRRRPAVLLAVGLHLPRFARQPGLLSDPALFLKKLGSLARMAISAAVQKRDFLRRHDRGRPAFLPDRARLVVVPVGLEAVARDLLGGGLATSPAALDFARSVVQRLRSVLEQDGPTSRVDACVDSASDFSLAEAQPDAAGLTGWDSSAAPRLQLRAAGALHAAAEAGTAALLITEDKPLTPEEVVDLLRHAWQQTQVVRLRLVRVAAAQRPLIDGPP